MAETEWDFRSVGPDEMQLDTIPGVPDAVRAAEGTDELREGIARWLYSHEWPPGDDWDTLSANARVAWRTAADALLAGPLAPLIRERDELLAKVQAVEALTDEFDRDAVEADEAAESFPRRDDAHVDLRRRAAVSRRNADRIRTALASPAPPVMLHAGEWRITADDARAASPVALTSPSPAPAPQDEEGQR